MKLWEKNYVLTMTFILFVLYGSLLFVLYNSFNISLKNACEQGVQTERSILYSVKNLLNEDKEHRKLKLYCEALEQQSIFFAVYQGSEVIAGSIPFQVQAPSEKEVWLIRPVDNRYLCISDSFIYQDTEEIFLYYIENLDELYENHQKQVYLFLVISALISFLIGGILYVTMKKIYYPINNIAHELRTPLTSIQGYAQYILFGKVSGEDIQYACTRINEEAGYINEMIERILIMENMKNGAVYLEKTGMADIFETVKSHYPSIVIDNKMEYIMGDKTLLLCLLMNLISNTSREGEKIVITANGNEISIYNKEDYIEGEMLKLLNDNRPIPKEKVKGKGLGVQLCHEIVKLHHGKLKYESEKKEGVRITITFTML